MIGVQFLKNHHDQVALETNESDSLLSIYGDSRMPIKNKGPLKSARYNDVIDDRDPLLQGMPGEMKNGKNNPNDPEKSVGDKYGKNDPRKVAVSWYSCYLPRAGSPTQWLERPDLDPADEQQLKQEKLRMMGMGHVTVPEEEQVPVKTEIKLLEQLASIADRHDTNQADMEIADIYYRKSEKTVEWSEWESGPLLQQLR